MISEFQRGTTAPIRGFQTFIRLPLANDDGDVSQIVSVVEFQLDNHEVLQLIADTATD